MAGEMARLNFRIGAEAAVKNFAAVKRIIDDYGMPTDTFERDIEEIEAMLEAGDFDSLTDALPTIMAQLGASMAQEDETNG
jgi:hypothetical protein